MASFQLSMLDEGGLTSIFRQDFGHDGSPLQSVLKNDTFGMTLESMLAAGLMGKTLFLIKIDIDGLDLPIRPGIEKVLESKGLRSMLIGVNKFCRQLTQTVRRILEAAGFQMMDREYSGIFEHGAFSNVFNQGWVRG